MQDDIKLCLAAGMDDFLSKPLNKEDLYAIIEKHNSKDTKKTA